ncbi:MAG: hypothetical protein ABIJ86_13655, partial [Spirochaetota bacterium]
YSAELFSKTIHVFDMANPLDPILLQNYTPPSGGTQFYEIVASNGKLYVYGSSDPVIIDIASNRSSITEFAVIDIVSSQGSTGQAIAVDGRYALIGSNDTVEVFDLASDPAVPVRVSTIPVNARSIAISGKNAVMGHRDGIVISIVALEDEYQ